MSTYNNLDLPLYETIQRDIISKIESGIYKTGDRIPSENEISRQYNVSRITATKALTELSLNGYINRFQGKGSFAAPLSNHLSPNTIKMNKPINDNEIPRIGLIIPEHSDYHSGNIISGFENELPFPKYFVSLFISKEKSAEDYALDFYLKSDFSAIALFPTDYELYSDLVLKMHLNKFPFVLIDRDFPGIACNSVTSDNEHGVTLAINHFTELGHTKIAFVSDSSFNEQTTNIRLKSYTNTLIKQNLQLLSYEAPFRSKDSKEAQSKLIADIKNQQVTAILASNSHVAAKIDKLCSIHKIRIPDDLSIICFDHPNIIDNETKSQYTCIDQDSYNMGKAAADILKKCLLGNKAEEGNKIILKPKLSIGNSTAYTLDSRKDD